MTLSEIGLILGLSRERVRQIEQEALRKIQRRAPWLIDYLVEKARSPAALCEDQMDEYAGMDWGAMVRHLRKRFRELGWDQRRFGGAVNIKRRYTRRKAG